MCLAANTLNDASPYLAALDVLVLSLARLLRQIQQGKRGRDIYVAVLDQCAKTAMENCLFSTIVSEARGVETAAAPLRQSSVCQHG